MEQFLYSYTITYYSDVTEKIETESGYALGNKISEIVANLEDFYGKNELESIESLKFISDYVGNGIIPIDALSEAKN